MQFHLSTDRAEAGETGAAFHHADRIRIWKVLLADRHGDIRESSSGTFSH